MLDKVSDFSRKLVPIFLATILGLVLVDVVGFKLDDEGLLQRIGGYDGFNPFGIRTTDVLSLDAPFGGLDVNVIGFPR